MQMRKVMTSYWLHSNNKILNQEYLQKYWSSVLQIWHQKSTSQKEPSDTYSVIAVAILLAPVSFCEKANVFICKWYRGFFTEHTWFSYRLYSPNQYVGSGWSLFKIKSGNFCFNFNRTSDIMVAMAMARQVLLLCFTFLVPSLQNTALIFREIFSIEYCTVTVEPPLTSSLSSFA